jgi:F-type H+-transporting ATPase subunit a
MAPMLRMVVVATIILARSDTLGAGILILENETGDTNKYVLYILFLLIRTVNLLSLVPGAQAFDIGIPTLAIRRLIIFIRIDIVLIMTDLDEYKNIFVPSGAPIVLLPLLYLIEIVSYLIRPLALVIRICVNLFCGHLLLVMGGFMRILSVIISILLLELGVALVQGYVYAIILILFRLRNHKQHLCDMSP